MAAKALGESPAVLRAADDLTVQHVTSGAFLVMGGKPKMVGIGLYGKIPY